MHASAYADAERFVHKYLNPEEPLWIADIGSHDFNGSLKRLFNQPTWKYVGMDRQAGPNVDVVLTNDYDWSNVEPEQFDVLVSTQVLEHVPRPWRWFGQVARLCKPGGLIYVCSPNTWGFHAYPQDCWRVWPDGLRALFEDEGVEPLELYAQGPDTTGIARKRAKAHTS